MVSKQVIAILILLVVVSVQRTAYGVPQIYWSEPASTSRLWNAKGDGSGRQILVSLGAFAEPHAIAIDVAAGHLYWAQAELSNNRILRMPLDEATGPERVVQQFSQ
jgi:hypothetical protein